MESDDYRDSHRHKGADYDSTIQSSAFDAYMDKWEERHLARVLSRLFPARIPRYLDFACGTGRITRHVEARADESVGVDVSESMLAQARSKCQAARFVCADLTRSDAELGPFDLVTAFRFFANAQDELRSAALAAVNRRLRPGGYLIVNNHRNPSSFLGVANRLARRGDKPDLTHFKLRKLLRRHGFEIDHQRAIGFWILRFKLTSADCLGSAFASRLERAFQYACFAPFAPDILLVARKVA